MIGLDFESESKRGLFEFLNLLTQEERKLLRDLLQEGKIEGRVYWDYTWDCGCFIGTIANRREGFNGIRIFISDTRFGKEVQAGLSKNPFEQLVYLIKREDTPQNNEYAEKVHQWMLEYEEMKHEV